MQQLEGLEKLREKFDDKVLGKLPRVTCRDCSNPKVNCTHHKKEKCRICNAFVSLAHIHLDYVGHAEVTDRLLTVDPLWCWEPVANDANGLPLITRSATGNELTLWIRLTVCGVTRVGCGSVAANAFDAEKQLIGDALRNAAMRFGVALTLWSKEELESELVDGEATPATPPPRVTTKQSAAPPDDQFDMQQAPVESVRPTAVAHSAAAAKKIHTLLVVAGISDADYKVKLTAQYGVRSSTDLTDEQRGDLIRRLEVSAKKAQQD